MHHICVVLSIGHAIELLFWPNWFAILAIKQRYSMCSHIAISPYRHYQTMLNALSCAIKVLSSCFINLDYAVIMHYPINIVTPSG